MATITQPPRQSWNRAETDRRVRHPLQRLRGYIRTYVALEGLTIFLLYLAIWFWAGLLLDFGIFKLFALDWVEMLPRTISLESFQILRTSILVILLAGLVAVVAFKVVFRLLREFRDASLALVMERRFPEQLGDRLITAVEMADPRLADKYGHSQVMVDQTIQDAASRVDKLPVTGVFNWTRLYRAALAVVGLTVGLYLLVGGAYCLIAQEDATRFLYKSRDVAAIWAERNILLEDTLWPRQAYLEIIRFEGIKNDPDEMHLSDRKPSTPLSVRGIKWVVADRNAPKGWRALRWNDLPGVLGHDIAVPLPKDWKGWTVDADDLDPSVPLSFLPHGRDGRSITWHGKSIAYVEHDLRFPGIKGLETIAGAECLPSYGSPLAILQGGLALVMNRDRLLLKQQALTGKTDAQPLILPQVKTALERAGLLEVMKNSLFRWQEWTIDRIEQQLEDREVKARLLDLPGAPKVKLDEVLSDLNALVDEGHLDRKLRRLEIPPQITLRIFGKADLITKDFTLGKENKYQDEVDFKESVRIQFQGADYFTPEKRIVLVPRPKVTAIVTNRWEPAYIYYRLKGSVETEAKQPDPDQRALLKEQDRQAQMALRGKRQQYLNVPARITEQGCYIEVPISGDLELIGEVSEDLRDEVLVIPVGKGEDEGKGDAGASEATHARFLKDGAVPSKRKFMLSFKNLTQMQTLKLKLVNEDGVEGDCTIVIAPKADDPPRVDVQMIRNVFRMKENVGYMVTPAAEVPFQGTVGDDRGLTRVEWRFRVTPYTEEAVATKAATMLTAHQFLAGGLSQNAMAGSYVTFLLRQMVAAEGDDGQRAQPVTTAFSWVHGGTTQQLLGAAYLSWVAGQAAKVDEVESRLMQKFIDEIVARKKWEILPDRLEEMLTEQPPKVGPLTKIELKTEEDSFSFSEHLARLKTSGENVFQKRYLVELWVAATDNNIEADSPVVSEDKKHFTFLVVGENELLAEIFREEEKLRATLDLIHTKLKTAKTRLDTQVLLPRLDENLVPDELRRKATRAGEVTQDISNSSQEINAVLSAFYRILDELRYNKVKSALARVQDDICDPLRDMQDRKTGEFKAAEDAAAALQGLLDRDLLASQGPKNTAKPISAQNKAERVKAGLEAQNKLDALIKRLEKVLAQIRETVGKDQLVRDLVEIEEKQRRQSEILEAHVKYIEDITKKRATGNAD